MKRRHKQAIFWSVAAACLLLDQVSKVAAGRYFASQGSGAIAPWPGILKLTYVHNAGGPFSLLSGHNSLLVIFSLVATTAVVAWFLSLKDNSGLQVSALAFIAGGAFGNLWDRIFLQQVRDFIDLELIHTLTRYHWPVFNLADVFICVGVGLMVLALLKPTQAGASEAPAQTD